MRRALALFRDLIGSDNPGFASFSNNLAALFRRQGDPARAAELYREALAVQRANLDDRHPDLGSTLSNLAAALIELGESEEAVPLAREALGILRDALGDEHTRSLKTLSTLADALGETGQWDEAELLRRESLAIRQDTLGEEHELTARAATDLGEVLRTLGRHGEAQALLREALAVRGRVLDPEDPALVETLVPLARSLTATGATEEAEQHLERAAAVFESARLRAGTGLARATFRYSPYDDLLAMRIRRGDAHGAWEAHERFTARALFDELASAASNLRSDRERELARRVLALQAEHEILAAGDAPEAETAHRALLQAEAELAALRRERALAAPPEDVSLERVQATLDAETALVGFVLSRDGEGRQVPHAWVVRHEGPVRWTDGPRGDQTSARRRQLREELVAARRSPFTTEPSAAFLDLARRMFDERLAPVVPLLEGVRQLVVVPGETLQGVPVETFVAPDGRYAADLFTIRYAPSAAVHTWLAERPAPAARARERALLVADPPFAPEQAVAMEHEEAARRRGEAVAVAAASPRGEPARELADLRRLARTRAEAEEIAARCEQAVVLLGAEASEENVAALARSGALEGFGLLHFATHAYADERRPERSALVLSQIDLPRPLDSALAGERVVDGLITAGEILAEWRLDAELVTLSGCGTALGRDVHGEGYVGFATAFLQAGAHTLLVSLWEVDDRAAEILMKRFYENLTGGRGTPLTREEALREARAHLRAWTDERGRRPFAHPGHWASFVLVGR